MGSKLDTKELGRWLRDVRDAKELSQDALAEKAGVSKGFISQLENEANNVSGKPTIPKLDTIVALADAVGRDVREPLKALGVIEEEGKLSKDEHGVLILLRELNPQGRAAALQLIEIVTKLERGKATRRTKPRRSVRGSRSNKAVS